MDVFGNRRVSIGFVVIAVCTHCALAQPFPTKPVTLVVPSSAGGPSDIVARLIQPKLSERLAQPIIVDNRPGASTQIGTSYVGKATPDGHTLLVAIDPFVTNAVAYKKLPYETFRDFAPVTLLLRAPLVLGVNESVKATNLHELNELAKRMPGTLNFGTPGLGTLSFLVSEDLKRNAGVDSVHVAYKGAGPVVQALVANEVQYTVLSYPSQKAQIQAGKIRPIAVTAAKRLKELPNVPTVAESGYSGFEAYTWIAIFAPANTPKSVVSQLHADFMAALSDPQTRSKLVAAGFDIVGSNPQELDNYIKSEYDRWEQFARKYNIQFQ